MIEKLKKNLIAIAIVIAGILIAGAIIYINIKGGKEKVLSSQEAAEKAINYINKNLLAEGLSASLIKVTEENGVYKFRLKIREGEFDSYVTKNGKLLFIEGINLEKEPFVKEEVPQEVPKRDSPDVKLFVMSYCPYGLQMQKVFLPVYDLLKDKAEMGVYFVNYIMHEKKEIDENLRQYCIQKEEKEKYYNYLSCFVKDGNFERCLLEANIDKEKMNSCITQTDQNYKITQLYNDESNWFNGRFPRFDVHANLNEKYGVRGSPTVVINDKVVDINPRSPENLKKVICQAFNSPPTECSQNLSNDVSSPGLGKGTGSSGGSCQ